MHSIDLNCDMGEGFGNYTLGNDEILLNYISSANIACGFHAGDPATMFRTVRAAAQKGVAIGAHPGLPDLPGFGRREMKVSPQEAYQLTLYQIGALAGFVRAADARLHHVKPHGALYNMAAKEIALANAIAEAIRDFDPALIVYALAGSELIKAAAKLGLTTASEAFADRTYQDDGSLTSRQRPDALIHSPEQSVNQVRMLVSRQQVLSMNGRELAVKAETICIHGDGEQAPVFARTLHEQLNREGITIKAP